MKQPPIDVLELEPVKVFTILIAVNRLAGFYSEVRDRNKLAIISAGVILTLIGSGLSYITSFKGIVGLGEGEPFATYGWTKQAPLGSTPELAFTVSKVDASPLELGDDTKVMIDTEDEETFVLTPGQSRNIALGLSVRLVDVGVAPGFKLNDKSEKTIATGAVKLKLYPKGEQDYFLSEALPHRFYLTITENDEKPIHLRIVRGKLVLLNKDISLSEVMPFDDLSIEFQELHKWAVLEVRSYPTLWIIYLGLSVVFLGAMIVMTSSRSKR